MRQGQGAVGDGAPDRLTLDGTVAGARVPLGRALGARVSGILQLSPALTRYVVLLWALTRLGFILITIVSLTFLRHISPSGPISFVDAWARYDATYYARLSAAGYSASLSARLAFFPLQPLLTRLATPLALGNIYVAGMVVSNVACLAALLGLASLASHDADEATARRAALYLTLFPSALFLFAGYADSLFLGLAIWCLVALRRGGWWQAGALGLLATATRQMGLFLVLPFAWEYGRVAGWRLRALRPSALAVLLIPIGLLLFMAWLWQSVGDPLAFVHSEGIWAHTSSPPWQTLVTAVRQIQQTLAHVLHPVPGLPNQPDSIFLFKDLVDCAAIVLVAALIVIGIPRLPVGDTLFSAALWLLAIWYPVSGWALQSDARYMLLIFPAFLTLARLGRVPWLHALVVAVFSVLLLMMTQYFVRGALIV